MRAITYSTYNLLLYTLGTVLVNKSPIQQLSLILYMLGLTFYSLF